MKSVYLQKDKSIFKLDELPVDKFAESLGLPGAPKIKFLKNDATKKRKNATRIAEPVFKEDDKPDDDDTSSSEVDDDKDDNKGPSKVTYLQPTIVSN
jgi:ATP-dependent RNA helicase DDX10/DBP4